MVDKERYQDYFISHTIPDIAYGISVVSLFMHEPKEEHLQAVQRILRYLKATTGRGILFKKGSELTIETCTDADNAGSVVDKRYTTGYCTFIAGNLITWRSKTNVVARSSTKAEFRKMAHGSCKFLWLKIILKDLRIKRSRHMRLYRDNKSAINIIYVSLSLIDMDRLYP